jgi:hypothetical protein
MFPYTDNPADQLIRKCVFVHEEHHVSDPKVKCDPNCPTKPCLGFGTDWPDVTEAECGASAAEIRCLCEGKDAACGADAGCRKAIDDRITDRVQYCMIKGGTGGFFEKYGVEDCRDKKAKDAEGVKHAGHSAPAGPAIIAVSRASAPTRD